MAPGLRRDQPRHLRDQAARALMLGLALEGWLTGTIAWIAVLVGVFAPLAIARYRRRI